MVMANNSANITIGKWSFDESMAHNLNIEMSLTTKGIGIIATADSVQLAKPIGTLAQVNLRCNELLLVSEMYACSQGTLSFNQKELGFQKLDFAIEARPSNEDYKVEIEELRLASSLFSVTFIIKQDKWQLFADTPQLQLTSFIEFITPYLQEKQRELLANWTVDGEVKLEIDLLGQAEHVNKVAFDFVSESVNLSDSDGLYVSEGLATTWAIAAERNQQGWQWAVDSLTAEGQAYAEPIFLDLSETPLDIKARGNWLQEEAEIELSHAKIIQENLIEVEVTGRGSLSNIDMLKVDTTSAELSKIYQVWLQPFAVGTALDNVELAGAIDFSYEKSGTDYQLSIGLNNVFVDDQSARFGIDGLTGKVGWSNYDISEDIALQWQGAYVYAIPLGASHFHAQTKHSSLKLQQPWLLPILDGQLQLKNFSLDNPGDDSLKWAFEGELSPISMESLSTALEWPLLHGKLSGVIPYVSYANQKVEVDGALRVKLFEGVTTIRDLHLDQPFGALPQLQANIDMKGLNLETLTRTFDFGKITGKLDGKLTDFRLSNWQPVHFDATFSTPEGDKSRRKISQKAVDNLSQIGGGATGVLQRSFLRFFEDFSYQRLGLSCKLRNEVCEMAGVGEAEQGYYIVKGGGLPLRINVVGYTRRVDWPDLIERLKAVSESSGPIVQ